MSAATKWLIGILVVFNIFMVGLMSILFGHHFDYKNRFQKEQQKVQDTKEELNRVTAELTTQINNKEETISDLKEKVEQKKSKIKELNDKNKSKDNEIAKLTERRNELKTELDKLRTTRDDLNNQVETLKSELSTAKERRDTWKERANMKDNKLQETLAKLRSTEVSLNEVQERFIDTKTELKDAENRLSKYRKQYGPISPHDVTPAVDGYVKAAKPELNILLINLGERDGLREGMHLSVVRGDKYVTEIVVESVKNTWSTARSISKYQKRPPQTGDQVTTFSPAAEGRSSSGTPSEQQETSGSGS